MSATRRFVNHLIIICLFLMTALSATASTAARNAHIRAKHHIALTPHEQHRLNMLLSAAACENVDNYVNFRVLLAQGSDPNTRQYFSKLPHTLENSATWLMWYAALGDTQTVKALLDHSAKVNARGRTCFGAMGHGDPDPRNSSALIDACCRSGNWDVIQLLLKSGANVNARDNSGNTPLGMAAWQSEWEECRLLLKHGAHPRLMHKWEQVVLYSHLRQS